MKYILTIEEGYKSMNFTFHDYEVLTVFMLTVLTTSNENVRVQVSIVKEGE